MFRIRTFGRERGPRRIDRKEFLGEAHRSSVTVYLGRWDVDALLSVRLLHDPHDVASPSQLLTRDRYLRLDWSYL